MMISLMTAAALTAVPFSAQAAGFGFFKTAEPAVEENYSFVSGNAVIRMGEPAAAVLQALGTPVKPVMEMDSCAYQGKEKIYTYPGFELGVGPSTDGKQEVITSLYVLDNTVATPENIRFGSAAADVKAAYGAPASEDYGSLHYRKGCTELVIYQTGSKVDGIEYILQLK